MTRPLVARVVNAISNLFAAGAIICLAGIGALWLAGCGGPAKVPVAPPTVAEVGDFARCADDLREMVTRAHADAGAE